MKVYYLAYSIPKVSLMGLRRLVLCYSIVLLPFFAVGQGMSVNTTGAVANSSAMLDVSSTSKGILIPRMTSTQRTTGISSPAQGLMVYQTDAPQGFYYYDGSAWNYVGTSTGTVTSVSSGNLSPIFTSTVTSSSITPTISYSLSNASAYSVLTNSTNATSVPSYGKVMPQALSGSNSPTSNTFYRGDGSWSTPLAGNMRTVTSNTTLISSDQIVVFSSSSFLNITLFSPGSVPKGYQLNLINLNGGTHGVLITIPSGMTVIYGGSTLAAAGSFTGPTLFSFAYRVTLISDGVSTWYQVSGE